MRRFVFVVMASLGLLSATSLGVGADVGLTENTQVTVSCTDGHSVVLFVDQATLASLITDVNSINSSGTGVTCTLDTASIDPSTEPIEWTVYDYNSSDRAIAPRNSPNSLPPATSGNTTTFQFRPSIFTALLTTTDPSLTGDLSAKTLTEKVHVFGDATSFMTQFGGGDCTNNVPATVRFYFTSPSASGSTPTPPGTTVPPAGFYTKFWWSNPMHVELDSGKQIDMTISQLVNDPSMWSDWDGQFGSYPAEAEAFQEAIRNVQSVGLSFGGLCFFETGVTAVPSASSESFSSTFTESP